MPAIYLTEADVTELLDMPTAIDAVQEAFRQLGQGQADNVPRQRAKRGSCPASDVGRRRLSGLRRLEGLHHHSYRAPSSSLDCTRPTRARCWP